MSQKSTKKWDSANFVLQALVKKKKKKVRYLRGSVEQM